MTVTTVRPGTPAALGRTARTEVEIHPLLAERWSTRAFDASPLADDEVAALLEAARWAPSAMNHQPWRFLVGRTGAAGPDATHAALLEAKAGSNQVWAGRAPLLVAALARVEEADGTPRTVGPYELGLAVAQLTVQAHALGLHVHQVGGFSADAVSAAFDVPSAYRPVVVLAVGRQGDDEHLPDWARERETAPRERLALEEIAFSGSFGTPAVARAAVEEQVA
ncbi:MAG: nitroreductase family protein [Candidatus Nanopelagicales bacterium]